MKNGIEILVEAVGSQSELARRMAEKTGTPVRQGHVWYWLRAGRIPETKRWAALEIARNAGLELQEDDLRPSIVARVA